MSLGRQRFHAVEIKEAINHQIPHIQFKQFDEDGRSGELGICFNVNDDEWIGTNILGRSGLPKAKYVRLRFAQKFSRNDRKFFRNGPFGPLVILKISNIDTIGWSLTKRNELSRFGDYYGKWTKTNIRRTSPRPEKRMYQGNAFYLH